MPDQPDNPIDPSIQALIRKKAAKLVRKSSIPHSDREDIEQELILDLLRRLPMFDAAVGDHDALVRVVINHRVSTLLRDRRAPKRGQGRTSSLDVRPLDDQTCGRPDESLARADLVMDVRALLQQLPAELRRVAELLQTGSIAEAARSLGVSRGQVYSRRQEIRALYERTNLRNYL